MDELFTPDVKAWNAHAIVTGRMKDHYHDAERGKVLWDRSPELKSKEEQVERVEFSD